MINIRPCEKGKFMRTKYQRRWVNRDECCSDVFATSVWLIYRCVAGAIHCHIISYQRN